MTDLRATRVHFGTLSATLSIAQQIKLILAVRYDEASYQKFLLDWTQVVCLCLSMEKHFVNVFVLEVALLCSK